MSWKLQKIFSLLSLAAALLINSLPAHPQKAMTHRATGMFDVKLTPQSNDDIGNGAALGRMSIDKRYHGVVPDSGTGQLAGIAGKMAITIAEGKHSYDFEYTLAGLP